LKKGAVAIQTIVYLVLAIGVIAVGYLVLGNVLEIDLMEFLKMNFNIEPPVLESMIKCSYYRCKEGCDSNEVMGLEWKNWYGEEVKCKDFCELDEWKDADGKICNLNSFQYPVEMGNYKSKKIVTKNDLEVFQCFLPQEGNGFDFGDVITNIIFRLPRVAIDNTISLLELILSGHRPETNFLVIENDIIDDSLSKQNKGCFFRGQKIVDRDSYEEIALKDTSVYISTYYDELTLYSILHSYLTKVSNTFVISSPKYILIEADELDEVKITKDSDIKRRISVQDSGFVFDESKIWISKIDSNGFLIEISYDGTSVGHYFKDVNDEYKLYLYNLKLVRIDSDSLVFEIIYEDPECHKISNKDDCYLSYCSPCLDISNNFKECLYYAQECIV